MRLGCAGKILGKPGLKSYDARRRGNEPHLSVSLAYLRDILCYLDHLDIRLYRLSARLAPYLSHPDMPEFHGQIEECESELDFVGALARQMDVRLTVHAPLHVVLSAMDEGIAHRSTEELIALARILDALEAGPEAVIVVHAGGVYDDKRAAMLRFARRFESLPEITRLWLALENDDSRYSLYEVWELSRVCECPVVFDRLHLLLNNPEGLPIDESLQMALESWPANVTPLIHFSSPRTDMHYVTRGRGTAAQHRVKPPLWSEHSDYINPFEFIDFMEQVGAQRDFDVMLEAKARDLAVIRLREDLDRFSPRIAGLLRRGRTRED